MLAANGGFHFLAARSGRAVWLLCLHLGLLLGAVQWVEKPAGAADKGGAGEPAVDGLLITVPAQLDSNSVKRIKDQTREFRNRPREGLWDLKIVYDFNPGGLPSHTSEYGVCNELAEFLLNVHDVLTIAFVHNDVTEHTVLPVLACKEVVMSRNAHIGDVLAPGEPPLGKDRLLFYETVAEKRGYAPALVLKMVDAKMEVVEGNRKDNAIWFIDRRNEAQETREGFRAAMKRDPIFASGRTARYDSDKAWKYGLCKKQLDSLQEVRQAYDLSSLSEDPLQGRPPSAWRIVVNGHVTPALRETLQRRISTAVRKGANLIILQLECGEGETEVARDLANFLRDLKDDAGKNPVKTVAYVTRRARDTATIFALGCTDILMDQEAHLGDFEHYLKGRYPPPKDWRGYAEAISKSVEELAERRGLSPLLARAMFDPKMTLYLVHLKANAHQRRLMDGAELDEDRKGESKWEIEQQIKFAPPDELLKMDSEMAQKLGVAKYVFKGQPNESRAWLMDRYGLEDLPEAGPDWLDALANFLRSPLVSVFLVMIGITGLILELKIPGVGLPGVVAAICFVLYFWAHSPQLSGHLTMLAVLLFLLGLILIGLEVFLLPGLGITGISGIVLVVISLGLVTLVKKPETTHEWIEFGASLTTISFSLLAGVGVALALGYYLPHIPWANRLVLVPPAEPAEVLDEETAGQEGYGALLGAVGEAATDLRPAGKARFGEEFIDVVAEGSYVASGARVQVIEIEGTRIVVKEV